MTNIIEKLFTSILPQIALYIGQYDIRAVLDTSRKWRIRWQAAIIMANWYDTYTVRMYYDPGELIRTIDTSILWRHIFELYKIGKHSYIERIVVHSLLSRTRIVWPKDEPDLADIIDNEHINPTLALICRESPAADAYYIMQIVINRCKFKYLGMILDNHEFGYRIMFHIESLLEDWICRSFRHGTSSLSAMYDAFDVVKKHFPGIKFGSFTIQVIVDYYGMDTVRMYMHMVLPYLSPDPIQAIEHVIQPKQLLHVIDIIESAGKWPQWVKNNRRRWSAI